ncbi:sterile alpha motif domain-containing protein 9-like [Gastrophryne carolinensis]
MYCMDNAMEYNLTSKSVSSDIFGRIISARKPTAPTLTANRKPKFIFHPSGSVGYTIIRKTADLIAVQKESNSQKVIAKEAVWSERIDHKPVENWKESDVSKWLKSIGLKDEYITKLHDDEVTGPALKIYSEHDLKEIGMKPGQIKLFLRNREMLLSQETDTLPEVAKQATTHSTVSNATYPLSAALAECSPKRNERHIQQSKDFLLENKGPEFQVSAPQVGRHKSETKPESKHKTSKQPSGLGVEDKHVESKSGKSSNHEERPKNILQNNSGSGAISRKQNKGKVQNLSEDIARQHIEKVKEKSPENKNGQKQVESSSKNNKPSENEYTPYLNISQSENRSRSNPCAETEDKSGKPKQNISSSQPGHLDQTAIKKYEQPLGTETTVETDQAKPQNNGNVLLSVNTPRSPDVSLGNQPSTFQNISTAQKSAQVNVPAQNITKGNSDKPQENIHQKPNNGQETNASTNKNLEQKDPQDQKMTKKMNKQQQEISQRNKNNKPVKQSRKGSDVKVTPETILQNPNLSNQSLNARLQPESNHGERQMNMAGSESKPGQSLSETSNNPAKTNKKKHEESLSKKTLEDTRQHIPKTPQETAGKEEKPIEHGKSASPASKLEQLSQAAKKKSEQLHTTGAAPDTQGQHVDGFCLKNNSSEGITQQNQNIPNVKFIQADKPLDRNTKRKSAQLDNNAHPTQDKGQFTVLPESVMWEHKHQQNQEGPSGVGQNTFHKNVSTEEKLRKMHSGPKQGKMEHLPQEKNNTQKERTLANFRPFYEHNLNFIYMKNHVLRPETGTVDLITPCHEYKSFATAATLDRPRLLAKLRYETFRFAAACLNVRSNGTIHFGIMDSVEGKGYEHGQIIGIPIEHKDWYADIFNDLDKSFPEANEYAAAKMCIRSPQFIEVKDMQSEEKRYVVEIDIEPLLISVKGKMFQVSLPKFDEHKNKTFYEKKTLYERVGTKSQSVKIEEELSAFNLRLKEADKRRKEAEEAHLPEAQRYENLGRKLSILTTNGKQYFDDTLQYVLVTNKCQKHQLEHLNFLKYLKILCVFDFDADSDIDGLYSQCTEYHATNIYTLQSYANEYGKSMDAIVNKLGLFKRISWVFCNGRRNFSGEDLQCDEQTWIREKVKFFKKAVSLICEYIIKRGSFIVLFMLLSPVEKPIAKAFNEFYEEMSGMDYITCITESTEYYEQWASLVQALCNRTELDQRSVAGMMWSHINATIQEMIPKKDFYRKLPVSTKAVCVLKVPNEEKMNSLNILCLNECENTNHKAIDPEKLESDFYRGGRISWLHFWLAEQNKCRAFIERQACQEVEDMLDGILNKKTVKLPVARINIVHQPGSGASTVARQILWKNKKQLRCAIVNSTYISSKVCEHAVQLREYEERDINNCLPVLLLLEDCTEEYIDELKNYLNEAIIHKKVGSTKPSFILLSCRRSNAPEKFCAVSHSDTVAITHKLKPKEQQLFKDKAEELNAIFSEDLIITFVLMSQEFNKQYLSDFVKNVLVELDHSSPITRLIRYVALLNHYVQNSYISLSHCEVLLGIQSFISSGNKLSENQDLNSLREQALIIELKDETTFISAIRILHPMIAEEILNQISITYPQSKIALGLLQETAALNHRFGQQEFVTFIKHLFFRRHRKSRGDNVDSFFSPLIEHVCNVEKDTEMAIQLLRVAYEQFNKDAHFAQQLARIHYKKHKFEEAKEWVETAKAKLPDDSYILDTEGRLYKEWFNVSRDKYKGSLPDEIGLIEHGLKAMECFRSAQRAATFEKDTINNSGYFGEVDVGCNLLDLLLTLFNNNFNIERGKDELVKYLTIVKYIPEELKSPWAKLHSRLKYLYQNMYSALEWISEDVGCFQTDKIDVWESTTREDYHENNPRKWLVRKTRKFAEYFSSQSQEDQSTSAQENQFARKMAIYRHGGGSVATILSLLSNSKPENPGSDLESVIDCYPREISEEKLDDNDLINLIMSYVALGSVCPQSTKLFSFDKLLEVSQRFLNNQKIFPASAYFLIFMLYWPDEKFIAKQHASKTNILKTAIETAKHLHQKRIKNVPVRKKRTNVLFFLGKGYGLQKFIFRGAIERLLKRPLNERTFRWDSDPKDQEIIQTKLKKVDGWTENGRVYTKNPYGKEKIEVLPLNYASVPDGDENVSFYLGFTYIGYVTYGIQVKQQY